MADPIDPTQVKTIEQMREEVLKLVEDLKTGGNGLKQIQDYLTAMSKIVNGSTEAYQDWDGTVEQVQVRIEDMVKSLIKKNKLSSEELDIGQRLSLLNKVAAENQIDILLTEEEIFDKLKEKIDEETKFFSKAKLFSQYEMQHMRNKASFFSVEAIHEGEKIRKFSIIGSMQQDRAKLAKQISEELTKEEAQIVAISKAMDLLEKGFGKIEESFSRFSKLGAELNKMGVDATQYTNEMISAFQSTSGVSQEEYMKAQKDLISSFSMFTQMSSAQREEVLKFSATMEKAGISSASQMKLLQLTTKSFNMSATEGMNAISRIKTMSEKTGISMTELDKNIQDLGNSLGNFGSQNFERVFQSLSIAAKNTGIAVNDLMSVSEKFTTFQGAAQAVGELNIALGTQLDTMSLMKNAINDPIKVFEQLKTEFDRTGQKFDELSLDRQRYIASIFGQDVTTASALFSQSLGAATAEMELQKKEQEELNKIAAASADVMTRLEIIFQKITASPLVTYMVKTVEVFISLFEYLGEIPYLTEFMSGLAVAVITVAGVLMLARKAVMAYTFSQTILNIGLGKSIGNYVKQGTALVADTAQKAANATATSAAAGAQNVLNVSTSKTGPGLMAAAGAALLFGIGIGAAAWGISLLAKEIKGMSAAQRRFLAVMTLMIVGMIALAVAILVFAKPIAIAAGVLSTFGLIVLGIVASIAALALAFSLVAEGMARYAEAEAKKQEAQNRSIELSMAQRQQTVLLGQALAQLSNNLAIDGIEKHLTKFAKGISKIAAELEKIPNDKVAVLDGLSRLGNLDSNIDINNKAKTSTENMTIFVNKGVSISDLNQNEEMVQRAQIATQQIVKQNLEAANTRSATGNNEIRVIINSPLKLDGLTIGQIMHDGMAQYEADKKREYRG